MKERDRLTRHSNISLIWHDTENTKTACIWLALGSHDVSVLESITVSERLANQRWESAARQRTRRTTTNDVNESGEQGQFVHFKESFVRTDSFANEPTLISRRRTLSRSGSPSRSGTYTGTPSRWTPLEKHTAKEKYPKVLREVFPNVLNVVMSNKSLIRLNTSGCRRLKSCQFYTYAYQNLLGNVFNHPRSNNWSRSPNDRPISVGFEAG